MPLGSENISAPVETGCTDYEVTGGSDLDDTLYQVILHDPVRRGPVSYVCLSRIRPPVRASAYLVSANFEPEYNTGPFAPLV